MLSNRVSLNADNFFSLRLMELPAIPGKRVSLELIQDKQEHNYLQLTSQPGLVDGQ